MKDGAKGRPQVQHPGQLSGWELGHIGLRGDGRPSPAAHEEHGGAAVRRGAAEGPLQPPSQRTHARGVRPEAATGRAEGVLPGPVQGNARDNGHGGRPVRHQECLRSQGEAGAETEPAALSEGQEFFD